MRSYTSPLPLLGSLILLLVCANGSAQTKSSHSPYPIPRGDFPVHPVEMNEARSTNTVLKEDFQNVGVPSIPSGWTSISPEGDFTTGDAGDANAGGYFPVPDIAGNIFAMANDDVCNCDMSKIRLISPAFDLSGLSNMVLRFNAYHDKNWGGGDATAQVSTDGGSTWDTLKVLNSSTDWQYYVLDLSAYIGNSNVQVKFQWSDGGTWASGFAVDNVVVDELLANDLSVEKVWTSEMKKDLEYSMLPLGQAQEMKVGTRIKNNGYDLQTSTSAAVTISRNGQVLVDDSTNSMDLDSMQRDNFWLQTAFKPDSLGTHQVEMEAFSDQPEGYAPDNVMSDSVQVTCDRMARDADDYNGKSWGSGTYSNGEQIGFEAGNLFGPQKDGKLQGVSFLLDSATEAGAKVRGVLYKLDTTNGNFDSVAVTSSYTVQSSDISGVTNPVWTELQFDSSIGLDSGSFYLAAFAMVDSSSGKAELGASGVVPHNTAYFRKDSSSSWTDVNSTPMIRLLMSPFQTSLPQDTVLCSDSSLTLDAGPGDSYSWSTGASSKTLDVDSGGTYSVTVTRGQCQQTDSVMVDTNGFQVGLPSDTMYCKDSTVTLDAGSGDYYMWSTGDTSKTVEVDSVGTYSVTVDLGKCQDSDSIKVDSMEFQVDLPKDTLICEDSTLTLDAGPGDSYLWSTGDQTRSIDVGGPSSYWVSVVKAVCRSRDTVMVDTVQNCNTGIKEHGKELQISVHPNPAKERLSLELDDQVRIEQLTIRDLKGRLVRSFPGEKRELMIRGLSEGSYILRVQTESSVRIERFMKD